MAPPWSELPPELLGLFAARLPFPNDRARFRAVCRSWRSALRHHHVQARQLIVLLPEGRFMTPSDGRSHPLPSFPENASCIGSTDDWLALRSDAAANGEHHYSLHNPFSKATVPLAALDSIIDKSRRVLKVLVRSTEDGPIVAVMTNSRKCPFILCRGGNSAWVPEPSKCVYEFIIDIAFLEGKLYAITQDENLFPIDIDLDVDGKLVVADGRRTIRQPQSYYGYNGWSASEDEDEEGAVLPYEEEAVLSDQEATGTTNEDHNDNEEGGAGASDDDDDDGDDDEGKATTLENERAAYYDDDANDDEWDEEEEPCEEDEDNIPDAFEYVYEDEPDGTLAHVVILRHLVESRGKLLMVRQHVQLLDSATQLTRRVEVFEAGADAWVPMTNGLGGGQALFVSMRFSKSVPAPCGEIVDDVIYFANTGEVFNMRSETCSPARWSIPFLFGTWVFLPELVV